MFLHNINFPRSVAVYSVQKLAQVDYTIANRVSDDVATIVTWAYNHDFPQVANLAIKILQDFDNFGSVLISLVVWIISNTK